MSFRYESCAAAASAGDLEELKKMYQPSCESDELPAAFVAVPGFSRETAITKAAAKNGHLDCLHYLHTQGCDWDTATTEYAAKNGHIDCLQYAYENGCPWDSNTTKAAAANGHLDCLRYAHENECEWNTWTTSNAATNGHLDCLQYAFENGCPWNAYTPEWAAENGHLECLRYAIENECPWNIQTLLVAAEYGQLDCLQYAFEKTGGDYDERIPSIAARNGQIDCFKYCFDVWYDPQVFWNEHYQYILNIINEIDLDDPFWRRLFPLDLSNQPELQTRVEAKKEEIKNLQKLLREELVINVIGPVGLLPLDVITGCVFPYL